MSQAEEREKRREERQRAEAEDSVRERRQRLTKLVSAAAFLAIIAVVVAVIVSQSGSSSNGSGGGTNLSGIAKVNAQLKGLPQNGSVLGDPSAKATLVEFGDLQCSTCQFYAENVLPGIISGPVRAGKAKIDFRPVEVIGPQSVPAAAAAEAAGQQGRFWSYIEVFYANQGGENSGYVTSDFLTAVAKAAGVPNIAKWNQDRKNPRWDKVIADDVNQFHKLGFTGTPSFAIQSGSGPVKAIPGQVGTTVLSGGQLEAAIKSAG